MKEILLEGVLEAEFSRGEHEGLLRDVDGRVREAMELDVLPSKSLGMTVRAVCKLPGDQSSTLEIWPLKRKVDGEK